MIGRSVVSALKDRRGAVAIVMAIALPVVIGAAGIGVEAGKWYMVKRQAQTAADTGAFAGALELAAGISKATAQVTMKAAAEQAAAKQASLNGFTDKVNDVTVVINIPPKTGTNKTDDAVEVIVTRNEPLLFAALFLSEPTAIVARAVGLVEKEGNACILALNNTKDSALWLTGSSELKLDNCSLTSNSKSKKSVLFAGSQETDVSSVWSAGGINSNGGSSLPNNLHTYAWPTADPYSELKVIKPLAEVCPAVNGNKTTSYSGTLSPGVYCGNTKFEGNVTLLPGTYYIDQGDLIFGSGGSGSTVVECSCGTADTGAGVTFVLTSSDPAEDAGNLVTNGNPEITLRAPSRAMDDNGVNYPYPGMLIIQDPDASVSGDSRLNGGVNVFLDGAIYFPHQELVYEGNSGSTACTLIVADSVKVTGSAKMTSSNCEKLGLNKITVLYPSLVE
jgi:Flp pilus assembly protein TadG